MVYHNLYTITGLSRGCYVTCPDTCTWASFHVRNVVHASPGNLH